jgi:poly(hydroxyalkanoate) depolymerase family esterase
VLGLQQTIAKLNSQRRVWEKYTQGTNRPTRPAQDTWAKEHLRFGTNPGALKMFSYTPVGLPARSSLLVVLHGCTQTAPDYAYGAGWKTLAEQHGFAILLPQQELVNNPNGCLNWFQPGDIRRDQGEALSIRQMIGTLVDEEGIDRQRIFVTGLSAGGAMTSVMLACYPEVFAGGAIIAGLPYGTARNVQQAFECMFHGSQKSAPELAALAREAASPVEQWPRISVWHGEADKTVVPANADEILKQWTSLHRLPLTPSGRTIVNGARRDVWLNEAGDETIEAYFLPELGHGTPIAPGTARNECGHAGPFLLDAGISSSYHIAEFFGLTRSYSTRASAVPIRERNEQITHFHQSENGAEENSQRPPERRMNIKSVIDAALKAAGLIKG